MRAVVAFKLNDLESIFPQFDMNGTRIDRLVIVEPSGVKEIYTRNAEGTWIMSRAVTGGRDRGPA